MAACQIILKVYDIKQQWRLIMSPSSCGSGILEKLSCGVLLLGLSWSCSQDLGWGCCCLRACLGWKTHFHGGSRSWLMYWYGWLGGRFSLPQRVAWITSWPDSLASTQASGPKCRGWGCNSFYNRALKVTCFHRIVLCWLCSLPERGDYARCENQVLKSLAKLLHSIAALASILLGLQRR